MFISGYGEDAFSDAFGVDRSFNLLATPFSLKELVVRVKQVICG